MIDMMDINKDRIINYDFQGWPICKMSIKDILEKLGATLDNGNWIIPDSDALNIYPIVVTDDGMGYGVNEEFIVDFSYHPEPDYQSDSKFCTIFRERAIDKIDLWEKAKFYPGAEVVINGQPTYSNDSKEWDSTFIKDIFETDNEFEYDVEVRSYREVDDCKMELLRIRQYKVKESALDWP